MTTSPLASAWTRRNTPATWCTLHDLQEALGLADRSSARDAFVAAGSPGVLKFMRGTWNGRPWSRRVWIFRPQVAALVVFNRQWGARPLSPDVAATVRELARQVRICSTRGIFGYVEGARVLSLPVVQAARTVSSPRKRRPPAPGASIPA